MKKLILIILFAGFNLHESHAQCACCGASSSGFSGGEITPGVFTLAKNKWLGETYADFRSFNGLSSQHASNEGGMLNTSALAVSNMAVGIIGLRYGLSNKSTLLIQQPAFLINSSSVSSKTFGDLLSLVNYIAYNKQGIAISVQVGMEWATGQLVGITNGSSISTGSGSYDPVAGLTIMKPLKRSFIRAGGFFKYTTKGFNETYFGNFFGHQLNYTFVLGDRLNACSPDTLKREKPVISVNAQLSGEWSQMQLKNNIYLDNTGSYVVLASTGLTAAFKGYTIPVTFSLPVYQHYRGEQNKTQFRFRIGLTKTF